ncbi:DsbA family oxidoreductase [Nakamurella leprariae]|uniref:DsbA family protein n=1 Tax=Nakamurella leprariae TaxID=2803911 RepID=A0A938YBS1_9ACTN|nr:DsbA family protein [Nakamurella leprariae]MBM9469590.1 DsbA family protein [Nakamurella leprariae]
MTAEFTVTWDYRCPFARNAHEHILTGLAAGADWTVHFAPFSLGQAHVEEGQPDVWDHPHDDRGILALQVGVTVRDHFPEQFPAVHRALFAVRHDQGRHLEDPAVLRGVLTEHGVDPEDVFARIDNGTALDTVRADHERYVGSHSVWGVPTFIAGDQAVFVRLMSRSAADADPSGSLATIGRVVDLLIGWPDLNEFKHTTLPR